MAQTIFIIYINNRNKPFSLCIGIGVLRMNKQSDKHQRSDICNIRHRKGNKFTQ